MSCVHTDRMGYLGGQITTHRQARDRRMDRAREARAAGDPPSVVRLWVSTARQANRLRVHFLQCRRHELQLQATKQTQEVRS